MLVGGVVDDKIQDDADAMFFCFLDKCIEILQRSVHRIDVQVIQDVVAKIDLRRWEARSDPDGIDAELFQIVEFGSNAVEIADAVVVTVGEAAGIELVEDGVLPPEVTLLVDGFVLGKGGGSYKE